MLIVLIIGLKSENFYSFVYLFDYLFNDHLAFEKQQILIE